MIVKNDVSKRIFWKLDVVRDLIAGDDQQVRAAVVEVSDPQGNTRLLRRSVKHLYPIEVRNDDDEESPTPIMRSRLLYIWMRIERTQNLQ